MSTAQLHVRHTATPLHAVKEAFLSESSLVIHPWMENVKLSIAIAYTD